jgi:hypothetical protein
LRANEGYLFFEDATEAEDFFNLEYANENITYDGHNPVRMNMANNYIPVKETRVIARIVGQ